MVYSFQWDQIGANGTTTFCMQGDDWTERMVGFVQGTEADVAKIPAAGTTNGVNPISNVTAVTETACPTSGRLGPGEDSMGMTAYSYGEPFAAN